MNPSRRSVLLGTTGLLTALGLSACSGSSSSSQSAEPSQAPVITSGSATSASLKLGSSGWSYDSANKVYYRLGVSYVAHPQAPAYENLAIYLPAAYVTGTKESSGKYSLTVNASGTQAGFTAENAPVVMPVNTPGYASQKPPTAYSYSDVSAYLTAGCIYVAAGMRGKDSQGSSFTGNAPWGVVDLKAAIRFLRYNAASLPGSTKNIFVFGHSGGGAQSAVTGASGDSPLFGPYLEALGAAMNDDKGQPLSDAVAGAMCWCPITSLDYADAAYEWNMGQFADTDTRAAKTWTEAYSKNLADAFAEYQNSLKLKSPDGKTLTLEKSSTGHYLSGSYYDYLISVLEDSLNEFIATTTFPYTPKTQIMPGMGSLPAGVTPTGTMPSGGAMPSGAPSGMPSASSEEATTYQTLDEYIAHLNSAEKWVSYDSSSKKAAILSLKGFVTSQKTPSKGVGAFDAPDRSATENVVMGKGTAGLHFSPVAQSVLKANEAAYATLSGWKSAYASSQYDKDFAVTDTVGKDVKWRRDMYNPMFFLSSVYQGVGTSRVAPHWRIRTGAMQGDTASTVELNLKLALENLGGTSVDFATVWGLPHTMAEVKDGDAAANFIAWVKKSL